MELYKKMWRICIGAFILSCLIACGNEIQPNDQIQFEEEVVRIIISDSSNIWSSDSLEIRDDDPSFKLNQQLYDLLDSAHQELDSLNKASIEDRLLFYKLDTHIVVKSLQADYYVYMANLQDSLLFKASYYKLALRNYEKAFGSLDDHYLKILRLYAVFLYEDLGALDMAIPVLERDIALRENRGDNKLELINGYRHLAYVQYLSSEYLAALCNIKLAIKRVNKFSIINTDILASCISDEADYIQELGEYDLSLNLLYSVNDIDTTNITVLNRILFHTNLARLYKGKGKYDESEKEFKKAKFLLKRDSTYFLYVQNHYFNLLLITKQYKKLIALTSEHIAIIQPNNLYLSMTYDIMALAFEGLNLIDSAYQYSNIAYELQIEVNNHSLNPSLSELKNAYDNDGFDLYNHFFRIKTKFYARNNDSNLMMENLVIYDRLDSMFEIILNLGDEESQLHLINHYARIFVDALEGYHHLYEMGILKEERILHFFRQSKSVLLRKKRDQQNSGLKLSSNSKTNKLVNDAIRMEWKKIRQNYYEYDNYEYLLKCLKLKSSCSSENKEMELFVSDKIKYKDIEKELAHDQQLLLAYVEFDGKMFGLSTDGNIFTFKKWLLDSLDLEHFSQFEQLISKKQINESSILRSYEFLAYEIYNNYVKPLVYRNKSIVDWFVIPDGPLLQIPFDALVANKNESISFDKMPYLLYDVRIQYLYDIEDVIRDKEKLDIIGNEILVFGYTDERNIFLSEESRFPELPGTIKEINALENIGLGTLDKYLGKSCTKYNFLSKAENADIIHIATHAVSNREVRDLNGVIFRDDLSQPDSNAWLLSSEEISAMNFNAKLVFLSACESGLGKIYKGEGVYNLGRAFLSAGVEEVVQSNWVLDDFSASRIVASFYKYYSDGEPVHKALRLAKLDYLKEWPTRSQPFFWSGVN